MANMQAWFIVRQRVDDNTEHNPRSLALTARRLRELAEKLLDVEIVVDFDRRSNGKKS